MLIGRDAIESGKPFRDQEYFYLKDGKIENKIWENVAEDIIRWKTGNCFSDKNDAQFHLDKSIVLAKLKHFADANNQDICLHKNEKKFILCYKRNLDAIEIVPIVYESYGTVVFNSYGIAQQAIKEVGEEMLKKFLF